MATWFTVSRDKRVDRYRGVSGVIIVVPCEPKHFTLHFGISLLLPPTLSLSLFLPRYLSISLSRSVSLPACNARFFSFSLRPQRKKFTLFLFSSLGVIIIVRADVSRDEVDIFRRKIVVNIEERALQLLDRPIDGSRFQVQT